MAVRNLIDMIKDQDGEGSGLDADLLRGLPADFTNSKNQNGYTKLPNGLIIQWGTFSGTSTANKFDKISITFPIAFPNTCLVVTATANSGNINDNFINLTAEDISTTGFTSVRADPNGIDYSGSWVAIGY